MLFGSILGAGVSCAWAVVPFCPFYGSRFPYDVTNPIKGTLIMLWLLGNQVISWV